MLNDRAATKLEIAQPPQRNDAKYAKLRGQAITISEAVQIYPDIVRRNFNEWVEHSYIAVIKPGKPGVAMVLDRADTLFCADVYRWRKAMGSGSGAPLLDEDGEAYQLRWASMALYQRERRKRLKVQKRKVSKRKRL